MEKLENYKELIIDKDSFSLSDVEQFEFMTSAELETIQCEVERDSGNYSSWDILRAFITYKRMLLDYENGSMD